MPRVIIQAFRGRTVEQKRELARRLTDDLVEVFGAAPDSVTIVIEESAPENFARGGVLELDRAVSAPAGQDGR